MAHLNATFVIIGGGIAGVSCAEQLAVESPDESVILVSSSPLVKAVRNLTKISDRLEQFDVAEECHTSLESRHPNCTVITATALGIDSDSHGVKLSNNQTLHYKKLCICSGAAPKVISKPSPYILGIRDTETVQIFQDKLSNAKRVIIVGNGGIATELAYEIENCEVIWVIKNKSLGATFFDAGAATFFLPCLKESKVQASEPSKRHNYELEGDFLPKTNMGSALGPDWSTKVNMKGKVGTTRNVHIQYECEVRAVYERKEWAERNMKETNPGKSKDTWPVYAELTNGEIYGCDFIISATGVIPNTSFLHKNQLLTSDDDGGIMVDDQMKTNVDDIFAAGDVCATAWCSAKQWFQMRLWTQARQMGLYVAKCMSCDLQGESAMLDICFDLFTHVTRFFGYKVILLGLYNGQKLGKDYEIILRTSERMEYVKVILQEGKMQGAILIGETDLEETFENLILNQLDLSVYGEDILNPNIDIEDYFD